MGHLVAGLMRLGLRNRDLDISFRDHVASGIMDLINDILELKFR